MKTNIAHTVTITQSQWIDGPWTDSYFSANRRNYLWHGGWGSTFTWTAVDEANGLYRLQGSTEQDCHFAKVFWEGEYRELLWVSLIGNEFDNGASCDVNAFRLPALMTSACAVTPFCDTQPGPANNNSYGMTVVRRYRLKSSASLFAASALAPVTDGSAAGTGDTSNTTNTAGSSSAHANSAGTSGAMHAGVQGAIVGALMGAVVAVVALTNQ